MKKFVIIIVIAVLTASCGIKNNSDSFKISIVSIVEIDPIVDLREGFKEVIDSSNFAKEHKIEYTEYNAQNDASIQNQIIDKLSIDKPDLIYVLGTPIAQSIQKRIPDVLLVQGTATDPVSAGLADSWEGSGRNYIATTDLPPIDKQINIIKILTPNAKRIGIIYNPGEINSVAVIKRLKGYLQSNQLNYSIVERPISNTSEVSTAVNSLIGKIDVIYLPPDNTAHAAIPVIGRVSNEYKIPFYATVESALEEGALATLSLDFYEMGKETAYLTLEVLNGRDPGSLPIKSSENPIITVNKKVAAELGIDLDGIEHLSNYLIK